MYFIIQHSIIIKKHSIKRINKKDRHSEHTKGSGCVEQNKSKGTRRGTVLRQEREKREDCRETGHRSV